MYNKTFLSQYNESKFYDWKELHVQRRISKLFNLLPYEILSQIDDQFPENDTSISLENTFLSWLCLFFLLINLFIIWNSLKTDKTKCNGF